MKPKILLTMVALALTTLLLAGDPAHAGKLEIKAHGPAGAAECCDPSADPDAQSKPELKSDAAKPASPSEM
jgi:hypothetical protein